MHKFHPMPEDTTGQKRIHATVPDEVYVNFMRELPQQGMIQFAIRLALESLPDMVRRDDAYREIFIANMKQMYENDRASWRPATPAPDPRQLGIFPGFPVMPLPLPDTPDDNESDAAGTG